MLSENAHSFARATFLTRLLGFPDASTKMLCASCFGFARVSPPTLPQSIPHASDLHARMMGELHSSFVLLLQRAREDKRIGH